jgi:hypothetical protein
MRKSVRRGGLVGVALAIVLYPGPAVPETGDRTITLHWGDTLRSVAARYYADPLAYLAIYRRNRKVFERSYQLQAARIPRYGERYPGPGPDRVYTEDEIVLPIEIDRDGQLDTRFDEPLSADATDAILRDRPQEILDAVSKGDGGAESPRPSPALVQASTYGTRVTRESVPSWYASPSTPAQRCTVVLCEHYTNLCYGDCLVLAQRLDDMDTNFCGCPPQHYPAEMLAAQTPCWELPEEMEFFVDEARTVCTEFVR